MTKIVKYKDNDPIKLQLWDSAGQERYRSLIPSYVKNANAIFIVYDISEKPTFDSIVSWLEFIKKHSSQDSILILCGNKLDKEHRAVKTSDGENFAKKNNMMFFEVSAKTNQNILNMLFSSVAKLPAFESIPEKEVPNLINDLIKDNFEFEVKPNDSAQVIIKPNENMFNEQKPSSSNNNNNITKNKKCC